MEKKEKPIEKMTATELRELALQMGGIQGVHAMKKEELLVAIRVAKGLPAVPKKETPAMSNAELKQKIRVLRQKREEALQQKNKKVIKILRKRINRLKKRTRKAA